MSWPAMACGSRCKPPAQVSKNPLPVTAAATAASPQLASMGMVPGLHQAIAARHDRLSRFHLLDRQQAIERKHPPADALPLS